MSERGSHEILDCWATLTEFVRMAFVFKMLVNCMFINQVCVDCRGFINTNRMKNDKAKTIDPYNPTNDTILRNWRTMFRKSAAHWSCSMIRLCRAFPLTHLFTVTTTMSEIYQSLATHLFYNCCCQCRPIDISVCQQWAGYERPDYF